jgi:hypothetical protein
MKQGKALFEHVTKFIDEISESAEVVLTQGGTAGVRAGRTEPMDFGKQARIKSFDRMCFTRWCGVILG